MVVSGRRGARQDCSTCTGSGLPERERVVAHEGLALPHEEGAVRGPGLDAILGEQALGDVPSIPSRPELPMEPLLTGVQLRAATGLWGGRQQQKRSVTLTPARPPALGGPLTSLGSSSSSLPWSLLVSSE